MRWAPVERNIAQWVRLEEPSNILYGLYVDHLRRADTWAQHSRPSATVIRVYVNVMDEFPTVGVVRERDSLGDRQNRLGVGPALSWTALTRFTGLDVGQAIWFVLGGSSSTVAIGV